jgi:hypothetical protein
LIDTDTLQKTDFALKYYAYCCLKYGSHIYIGGMNFIQIFDLKLKSLIQTIPAGKLIYKLLLLDTTYLLCGGSYILTLLRLTDYKLLEVCKFDTTIYDMCRVQTVGETVDYALATWEGVQFVRIDCSKEPYELQFLPLRLREKEAINNVCRVRENMVAYADGSQVVVYNRVTGTEWC